MHFKPSEGKKKKRITIALKPSLFHFCLSVKKHIVMKYPFHPRKTAGTRCDNALYSHSHTPHRLPSQLQATTRLCRMGWQTHAPFSQGSWMRFSGSSSSIRHSVHRRHPDIQYSQNPADHRYYVTLVLLKLMRVPPTHHPLLGLPHWRTWNPNEPG